MKRIYIISVCLLLGSFSFAQSKVVQRFYDQYRGLENVENIKLRGWMLRMASNLSDSADDAQLLRKISNLQILTTEDVSLINKQDRQSFLKNLREDAFEDLITIQKGEQLVEMMIREDGDMITDFILMVSGESEFLLINMEGGLKFSDLNDLNINIEGAEYLKKLPEKKSDIPRA